MATDHDTFQPCPLRDGFIDAGIAFADCFAREDSVTRGAPLDTTAKETFNILPSVSVSYRGAGKENVGAESTNICYIVMTPREYGASLVRG